MLHSHETHSACSERMNKMGGKAECCYCVPGGHDCELPKEFILEKLK